MTRAKKLLAITAFVGLLSPTPVAAGVNFCKGGAQEAVNTLGSDDGVAIASAVFVPLAITTVSGGASGPAGDPDTYIVTFSAEASGGAGGNWEVRAEFSVNGGVFVPIFPIGGNTFHQVSNGTETHTMTWCVRAQATASAVFRIALRKNGGGTAIVDEYITLVERSN